MNELIPSNRIDAPNYLLQPVIVREEERNNAITSTALRSLQCIDLLVNLPNLDRKCIRTILDYFEDEGSNLILTSLFFLAHHPANNHLINDLQMLLIEIKAEIDTKACLREDRTILNGALDVDLRDILLGRSFHQIKEELVNISRLASHHGIDHPHLDVRFENNQNIKETPKEELLLCTPMICSLMTDSLASTLFSFYAEKGEETVSLFDTENTWLSSFFQHIKEKLPITYYRNDYGRVSINNLIANELNFCKLFLREGYLGLMITYLTNVKINFVEETSFNLQVDPSILPYPAMSEERIEDFMKFPNAHEYFHSRMKGYILATRLRELTKLLNILDSNRRPDFKTKRAIHFIHMIREFVSAEIK